MRALTSSRRIIPAALIIVGATAGLALGLLNRSGVTTGWAALPSPPEPAHRIIAADEAALWIEAQSGARYFFSLTDSSRGWTVTDASNAPSAAPQPGMPRGVNRPTLEGMASTFDLEANVNGRPAFVSYAVANSGSVHRWIYSYSSQSALTILAWILAGAIAGAALPLLVLSLQWPPSRVREGSAPSEVTAEVLRTPRHPPGF